MLQLLHTILLSDIYVATLTYDFVKWHLCCNFDIWFR